MCREFLFSLSRENLSVLDQESLSKSRQALLKITKYEGGFMIMAMKPIKDDTEDVFGNKITQSCSITTIDEDSAREIWTEIVEHINLARETMKMKDNDGDEFDILDVPGECSLEGVEINYKAFDSKMCIDLFALIRKYQNHIDNLTMMGW